MQSDIETGLSARPSRVMGRTVLALLGAAALFVTPGTGAALQITPRYTATFNSDFGANSVAAQTGWMAAADVFQTNLSDSVHVNLDLDPFAGSSLFGRRVFFPGSPSYANRAASDSADTTNVDAATVAGLAALVWATDPFSGGRTHGLSQAQAATLGLPGNYFDHAAAGGGDALPFSGSMASGTFGFQQIAAHALFDATNGDLSNGKGPGEHGGSGECLSANDCWKWLDGDDGPPGIKDAFDHFSNSGHGDGATMSELHQLALLDNRASVVTATPEPSTLILLATGLAGVGAPVFGRRRKRHG